MSLSFPLSELNSRKVLWRLIILVEKGELKLLKVLLSPNSICVFNGLESLEKVTYKDTEDDEIKALGQSYKTVMFA